MRSHKTAKDVNTRTLVEFIFLEGEGGLTQVMTMSEADTWAKLLDPKIHDNNRQGISCSQKR